MTDNASQGGLWLDNERATEQFGRAIARAAAPVLDDLPMALVITLSGDLGAGKTCLARGVVRELGHDGAVKSPTYTLMEPYEDTAVPVCHFDLYRLVDAGEVEFLGVDECFEAGRLCLIEWPERGAGGIPEADLAIVLTVEGVGRRVAWTARSAAGRRLVRTMSKYLDAGKATTCR